MSTTRVWPVNSVYFPPEIWLHIAHYLPSESLQKLRTLNHAVYEAAMDDRYSQMELCPYSKDLFRNMVLIKYPSVARRVRVLHISPLAVEDFAFLESMFSSSPDSSERCFEEKLFHHLRPLWSSNMIQDHKHPETAQRESTESLTQLVMGSIKGFVNVEEYTIHWDEDSPQAYPFDISLINAGWPVFGQNLRKVSIRYPLDRFSAVFPPPVDLKNLDTLDMEYFIPFSHNVDNEDVAPLLEALGSSLHTITSIRSLRLTAEMRVPFDISPFFRALQVFPRLHTLCIQVPFKQHCLADSSAVSQVINRHRSTLQHLSLDPNHPLSLSTQDVVFCHTISSVVSFNLLSLELYLGRLSAETALKCIEPFSQTLTSLVLLGRCLAYDQFQLIVTAFLDRAPHDRLTVLAIGVSEVTPEVLDLLSVNLPSLKKLCLTAAVIDKQNSKFRNTARVYKEWKDLTSLWIARIYSRLAAWSLTIYLADHCIPTIRECDGHPVWTNRCDCAILKIDSLRDVLNKSFGRARDDTVARRYQIVPYACNTHCLRYLTRPMKYVPLSLED